MIYRGYKIERINPNDTGNWGKKWGVFVEEHRVDHISGRSYVRWKITHRAYTLEEAKRACRSHFGRLF